MSKYEPLWLYIKEKNENILDLSFEQIKKILGFDIDHSFLAYKKELEQFGYKISKISLKNKKVNIMKSI